MNLDLEAAKTAQDIIKETGKNKSSEVENLITKTLGVLQENGVYACMLYLYSRTSSSDKAVSKAVKEQLLKMTEKVVESSIDKEQLLKMMEKVVKSPIDDEDNTESVLVLNFLTTKICNDLDNLFLTKQLWEQTLTYARYGAKAREE